MEMWPFQPRYQPVTGGRLHYVDEGRGEPILFVHGTPTWSFEWRHLIGALCASHRCLAVDHLGFGHSDRPADAGYFPEDHARRLAEFVDALGLRDFTLVVHDFGGPIGLPLALDPRFGVARVVLLNTWMWSFADDKLMARGAKLLGGGFGRFLYRRLNLSLKVLAPSAWGDKKKLTPEIQAQYLARFPDADSRGRVLWALAKSMLGSSAYYESLWAKRAALQKLPVLIVWGEKDSAFRPYLLDRWTQTLPDATVVRLPGAGHWPHEEEPEAVATALSTFLQSDSRAASSSAGPIDDLRPQP